MDAGARTGRRAIALGLLILLVFFVFRLALLWRFPPFYDEAVYADWALKGLANPGDRFLSLRIGVEPLFPWLGSILLWLGAGPFTAVRAVSLASGLVTLVMCALIGRELGGWSVGLAASGLAALLPFFVVHDVIGIYDPLATAIVATALFLTIRIAREPMLATGFMLGVVLGAGLLTKRTTYPALALVPVGLLVFDRSPLGRRRRLASWAGNVALAFVVAYALYSIMKLSAFWDEYVHYRRLGGEGGQPVHSVSAALDRPAHWLDRNWGPYWTVLFGYVSIPILAAAALGAATGLRRRPAVTLLLVVSFVVPFFSVLLLADAPYARYLLVAMPPLLVFAGHGAVVAWDRARMLEERRLRSAAIAVGAVVLLAPALVFDARVLASPRTAQYPGLDDRQYVTSAAALAPYEQISRDLRRLAAGRPTTVTLGDFTSSYLEIAFRHDSNITLVRADHPAETCPALYAVESDRPLPARPEVLRWRAVERYPRPRHGVANVVYEAVVDYRGRVVDSPEELRKLIGADRDYDAYGARHPCARAWAEAWYLHTAS